MAHDLHIQISYNAVFRPCCVATYSIVLYTTIIVDYASIPAKTKGNGLSGKDQKILEMVEAYHMNELCYPTGKSK